MAGGRRAIPLGAAAQAALFVVVVPLLPLLISRHWDWWEAWVFAAISIFGFGASRLLAARRHPDLLAERARFMSHNDVKSWDKVLARVVGLGGAAVPFVAGVDALFRVSAFGWPLKVVAFVVLLGGYVLSSAALIENRFFSGVVRIQHDRGHYVVSSGPYRWIRHPGYAGALLVYFATPFFLDSWWACLPSLLLILALIVRTHLEDLTLLNELSGYRVYAQRVHCRLVPGVW
jgi:protein-S-isoprenylcysteine O-methyltransferase Ste14